MRFVLALVLLVTLAICGALAWQRLNAPATVQTAQADGKPAATAAGTNPSARSPADIAAAQADRAAEAAIMAADRAADATGTAGLTDPAMTLQGFDPDRLRQIIAASDLPASRKAALLAKLAGTDHDPARIPSLLQELEAALP